MAVVDPKKAEGLMLKAKLRPKEPYKSATSKWECECLQCGDTVFPKYNWIKSGQGGCRRCGYLKSSKTLKKLHEKKQAPYSKKPRLSEAENIKLLKSFGRIPLEPFKNSRHPWLSKCKKCGTIGSPALSILKQRGNSCKTCGKQRTSDSKKLSQNEVRNAFKKAGVELLVKYNHINHESLKCRCLRCKRIVTPSYANVRKNQDGCKHCSGNFVIPKDAEKLMISFGYKPKVKYPGTDSPWKVQHIKCGSICYPTYGTIKRGGGGCRNCADWGFSTDKPSYIYLITHEEFNAHKVGIANQSKLIKSDRVHKFKNHGWKVHKIWQFKNGYSVLQIESEVFKVIRKEMKIPQFLAKGQMKYEGETETMSADSITLLEIEKIIKKAMKKYKK